MDRLLSYLALSVPILAWGLSFPSIKAALTEFPPMTLAFGRFVLAALLLAAVQMARGKPAPFSKTDWWAMAVSVFVGITLYFLFENNRVLLIPASAASLIIAGIPVLTLLAEAVLRRRPLGWVGVSATLVSFAGAGLLIGVPEHSDEGSLWGYLLMGAAAVSWVVYLYTMKPLQKHPNLTVTAWQMVLGALSFAPLAMTETSLWKWPSLAGWGHLAFQGIVCSAVSYLAYNYALEKLGMRTASLAVNLIPVVTAISSYYLLGERLGPWQWAGGTLVLLAVVVVGLKGEKETKPAEPSPGPGHG